MLDPMPRQDTKTPPTLSETMLLTRIKELEEKLTNAVAGMTALTDVSTLMQSSASHNKFRHNTTVTDSIWSQWSKQLKFARTTLAELTGETT